ncbi:MAG: RluA family pseudouridine synthase [Pirellulales bacterium]|nr:RluA family pseudouridine synthase [Pirellulales bacterium]
MFDPSVRDDPIELEVEPHEAGVRLDWYLAHKLPIYSRTMLRKVINAKGVTVDGHREKASAILKPGQRLRIVLPPLPKTGPRPEPMALDLLYEDESLAAVNKPPGMVVHPARGHWSGTLASGLQHHFNQLSSVGGPTRPGIVHRLDRDTSGVIVVAKTDTAHLHLAEQFQNRTVQKQYLAIVVGAPELDRDFIDLPIGLHPYHRERMAIRHDSPTSKEAQSFYEVVERFRGFALVRIVPKTGRTHQIRVHLTSIGCPVLCDRLYGGRASLTRGDVTGRPEDTTELLARQALHAQRLCIVHPVTGRPLEFTAPLPADMEAVLQVLRLSRSL